MIFSNNTSSLTVDPTSAAYNSDASPLADPTSTAILRQSSSAIAAQTSDPIDPLVATQGSDDALSTTSPTADTSSAIASVDWNSGTQDNSFNLVSYDTPSDGDPGSSIVVAGGTITIDPGSGGTSGNGDGSRGNSGGGSNPEDDFNRAIDQAKKTIQPTSFDPGDGTDPTVVTPTAAPIDYSDQSTGSIDLTTTNSDQSTGSTIDPSNANNSDRDPIVLAGGTVNDPNGTNRVQPGDPASRDPNPNRDGNSQTPNPFQQIIDQLQKKTTDAGSFAERYALTSPFDPLPTTVDAGVINLSNIVDSAIAQTQSIIPGGVKPLIEWPNSTSYEGYYVSDDGTIEIRMFHDSIPATSPITPLYTQSLEDLSYFFKFTSATGEQFSLFSDLTLRLPLPSYIGYLEPSEETSDAGGYTFATSSYTSINPLITITDFYYSYSTSAPTV